MITLHTDELDVRQLLELMSRQSGLNILVSPGVSGNITANFEKISPDELLTSVLKLANLVDKIEGSVHFIYSKDDLRDQSETKMKEKIVTKVYRLNYIRADEMMMMIRPFLSQEVGSRRFSTTANYMFGVSEASTLSTGGLGTGGGGGGMSGGGMGGGMGGGATLGGAGTIQRGTQPTTGGSSLSGQDVLIIQDYESNLKIIDQIIEKIDVPPVQVLIEAVIIQVELDKEKQLGVNFAVVDNLGQQLGSIGSGYALNNNVGFSPAQVLTSAGKIAAGAVSGAAGAAATAVDPNGFTSDTNGIKYGFVSNNVTGFVRAVETLGSTKILASPRILVLNKQRAEIQLGSRLGFKSITTQNYIGTTQGIQFLNTGTLLRLRPFVSDDGLIRMEIHPERSTGSVDATTGLPSAQTAELTTNVMVPNGTTLVIGGLMEDEDDYTQQGLPGLSRLPVLGAVFGLKDKIDKRRELVVLLTPHVWTDNMRASLAARGSTRSHNGPVNEATSSTTPPSRPPSPAVSGEAAISASAGGPAPAATSGTEGSTPMATRTGWWDREKARFRERRSRTAITPATATAATQTSSAVGLNANVSSSSAPQPGLAQGQPTAVPMGLPVVAQARLTSGPVQTESPDSGSSLPSSSSDPGKKSTGQVIESQSHDVPAETPENPVDYNTAPPLESLPPLPSARRKKHQTFEVDPVVVQNRPQAGQREPRVVDQAVLPASASLARLPEKPRPTVREAYTGAIRYRVPRGESFETMARKFYGSPQQASLLWWANRNTVAWPEALKPGTTIIVPPLDQLAAARLGSSSDRSRRASQPVPLRPAPPAPFPLEVPVPAAAPARSSSVDLQVNPAGFTVQQAQPHAAANGVKQRRPTTATPADDTVKGGGYALHVVRTGETLQSIAGDRLKDVRRRQEIVELNPDLLGNDGRLTPGLRLLLPGDAGPPRAQP